MKKTTRAPQRARTANVDADGFCRVVMATGGSLRRLSALVALADLLIASRARRRKKKHRHAY